MKSVINASNTNADPEPNQTKTHHNNFGFLRLLMAMLVILSHSTEMIDGNRSREILSRVFGSLSFGEFAVDNFFLISGYLITQSYMQSRSIWNYLYKRVLRIYPGFIVAFFFCLFIVGPLAGGSLAHASLRDHLHNVICFFTLNSPRLSGIFEGLHYRSLNGPMWSISYEFRCYILITVIGLSIFANRRRAIFIIAVILLLLMPFYPRMTYRFPTLITLFTGTISLTVRLFPIFLSGSLFYLYRDRIVYRRTYVIIAFILFIPMMCSTKTAEPALATLWGYILFWFAFHVPSRLLSKIGGKIDLSYGAYLYAWPVQSYLIWKLHVQNPLSLFFLSSVITLLLAFLSWIFVERPFLKLKNRGKKTDPSQGVN